MYTEKEGAVYLEKECKEHGFFSCLISVCAGDFKNWKTETVNIKPKETAQHTENGCPFDCGPCENHHQTACCVLIDVTTGCDQSCALCFASAVPVNKKEPSIQKIEAMYDRLIKMSETRKFNIQLSGGEPAVRDDLTEIIKSAKVRGFEYVQINTNGKRIGTEEGYADALKQAGADAIFMQFDSLSDGFYEKLRGEKLLEIKKKAVENCRKARLPVAFVPTIVRGINDHEIGDILRYALENIDVVKGVHFQPVGFFGRFPKGFDDSNRFTMFDTINEIHKQTDGLFHKEDLLPISTGHNLCCFYATYSRQEDGSFLCTSSKRLKQGNCCGEEPCCPPGVLLEEKPCCPPDIEVISRDRDYVLKKWKMAGSESADGFDEFLNSIRENSFTLTGMAFQDIMNLDTERVSRCRVQNLTEDGRLIPFCLYNLTDLSGNYLYRDKPEKKYGG